jgi:RNA polymerase sigma-70 factor (ECF subfamily)
VTDELLKDGLVKKDKEVFDFIFNYYYSSLCTFALHFLRDRDACEDLVQDFFVALWSDSKEVKIRSIKSFLFTGIRNRCLDFLKHNKVTLRYHEYVLFSAERADDTADHYFAESELRMVVEKNLEKLSPRCREIFELSRTRGLSNTEISQQLDISKRTVELQISNALKVLRKGLMDYLPLWMIAILFH